MKKLFVSEMKIGAVLRDEVFCVKELTADGFLLSDRSGSVEAIMVANDEERGSLIRKNLGAAFKVTGPVLKKDGAEGIVLQVRVKEIALAPKGTYLVNEVYGGITEEAKANLLARIESWRKQLSDPELVSLVNAVLTEETLEKLALYPATHDDYGTYVGGALVATAAVTSMCVQSANLYVKCGNGISTQVPDWNLLVTAALLHQVGKLSYFDEANPFQKSCMGVVMNYYSTLQDYISGVIGANGITIEKLKYAKLLNILQVSVSDRTDTRSVTKEGRTLRSVLRLLGELDVLDWCGHNHSFEEGELFYYEPKCNSYIFAPKQPKKENTEEVAKCS